MMHKNEMNNLIDAIERDMKEEVEKIGMPVLHQLFTFTHSRLDLKFTVWERTGTKGKR
ncbi:MAG: hypothetical protein GWN31_09055 [Candidatus Thorarchaeota archaeon]|nr:hypothetical protein [Candidatus Thorarchaeota archaeon]NIW14064.1 hypothetical protein [Candidatus Thorarchaeota archaeon]